MLDISFIKAAADGIAALLFPDLEAVAHDARTGLIAHIANGFSKRKVGDPSLICDLPLLHDGPDVIGPYEKAGANNRTLRSISKGEILLALAEARACGLLNVRNFADYVAEYFEISRATVYNYLKALPDVVVAEFDGKNL